MSQHVVLEGECLFVDLSSYNLTDCFIFSVVTRPGTLLGVATRVRTKAVWFVQFARSKDTLSLLVLIIGGGITLR